MAKKNRIKKLFERAAIEPADTHPRSTESVQSEQPGEATPSVENPQEEGMESTSDNLESSSEKSLPSDEANAERTESVSPDLQNEAIPSIANSQQEVMESTSSDRESVSEKSLLSEETMVETTESVSADLQNEAIPSNANPQAEGVEATRGAEESSAETSLTSVNAEETSTEDALEDVRRSLIEEEIDKGKKESKWWRRIGRKAKRVEPEESPFLNEIDLPSMPALTEPVEEQQRESESKEEVDQIDDLIDMLAAEREEVSVEATAAPEVEVPPKPEVNFEELKKQVFSPRTEGEAAEPLTDVRSMALEGGEEVLVEVDRKAPDPFEERLSAFENALKPYRLYINIALAMLGVVMAVIASLIIYRVYQGSRPEPVKEVSNLPYPTGVSLPGGWSFKLGKGTLHNGKWYQSGAVWLVGTEVCRWVSLPWSRQLEAVVRTLNPKDPIDLVMSNNDKFTYQVYSVRQLTPEELQKLDSNSPCLLLILTQPDAEKRWVLTALP